MTLQAALMLTLACALALGGGLGGGLVRAADELLVEPVGEPVLPVPLPLPFGELRTWYNSVKSVRMPIEQQALRDAGNRAFIPPRSERAPWQARLAAALEYDDNLRLSPTERREGAALVVTPGLNFVDEGPRHRVEVDASAELLRGSGDDYGAARVDASTLRASVGARSSPTTTVNYFGTLLRSRDPAGTGPSGTTSAGPLPGGTAAGRFAADYQRHELGFGWRAAPRIDLSAAGIGIWARSRSPDFVRTQASEVELAAHWQASALQRLALRLRERRADFEVRPGVRHAAAWVEAQQQWSPTLLANVALGLGRSGDARRLVLWRAGLAQTFARGQWDLAFERDVNVPAGLGQMAEQRSVRLGAAWRVGARTQWEASIIGTEYRPQGGVLGTVQTWRPRLALTLPVDAKTWLNLRLQRVDDRVLATDLRREGNRLLATVLRTF